MKEEEFRAWAELEHAKHIEAIRATGRASAEPCPSSDLSRLILQEYYQRGRLEMIRELLSEYQISA